MGKDPTRNSATYHFKLDMDFDTSSSDEQARAKLSQLIIEEVSIVMGMPTSHFEVKDLRKGSVEVILGAIGVATGLAIAGWSTYSLWFDGNLTPQQIQRRCVAAGGGAGLSAGIRVAAAVSIAAGTTGTPF